MLYLIIWVACAFWGYNIMQTKKQEPILGALLGGLLGLIGVIICYCFPTKV